MEEYSAEAWRLIQLLAQGEFPAAEELLRQHPGVLAERNAPGETPIHWLAVENHVAAVRFLLERGDSVESPDHSDSTLLIHAAGLGNAEMVRLLISFGARVDARSNTDESPLRVAAAYARDPEIIDMLLAHGAQVQETNDFDETPLHTAAARANVVTVKRLLECGASPNTRAGLGETPLHRVAFAVPEDVDSVAEWVSSLPVPDVQKADFMMDFEARPAPDICGVIDLLLEWGCDIHAVDDTEETALHKAAFAGNITAIRHLLHRGIDPLLRDSFSRSALDVARDAGHAVAVHLLAPQ